MRHEHDLRPRDGFLRRRSLALSRTSSYFKDRLGTEQIYIRSSYVQGQELK